MLPGLRHGELTTTWTSFNFARSYWSTLYSDGQHTIVILYQVVFELTDLLLFFFFRLTANNLVPPPPPVVPHTYQTTIITCRVLKIGELFIRMVPHAAAIALLKIPLLWAPLTLDITV